MTEEPKKLSPELTRWISQESSTGRRTVVITLAYSKDFETAAESLQDAGLEVQSSGPGTIVAVAHSASLAEIAEFEWVVAVGTPKRLDKKL